MIFKFSLYGFLKNQLYFEPFFLLILMGKGLSFFEIGIILGFRDLCKNLFEIPSGLLSDSWGRKKTLIGGWLSYIISFILFTFSGSMFLLLTAALFFGFGEAFRTGTHKAIIFSWLNQENRLDEKTKVYGFTRSWSKFGSALSVIISGTFVLIFHKLEFLFLIAVFPYLLNILNFLTYPQSLDIEKNSQKIKSLKSFFAELFKTMKNVLFLKKIRKLIMETVSFEGSFKLVMPYFQIVLLSAGIVMGSISILKTGVMQNTAILIMISYFILHLLSGFASKYAFKIVEIFGDEENASRFLWKTIFTSFLFIFVLIIFKLYLVSALFFIILSFVYNSWRPIFYSRFDKVAPKERQATLLSIESQAKSLFLAIFAPITGLCMDKFGLITIPIAGLIISSPYFFRSIKR
jgi:MFS family permease